MSKTSFEFPRGQCVKMYVIHHISANLKHTYASCGGLGAYAGFVNYGG